MEAILASGDFKIVRSGTRYGVLLANKEVDWFDHYKLASELVQNLFVAKASTDDEMIGAKKFCPAGMGNGQIVIVIAKTKNGYVVQPSGTNERMEVTAEVLSEPLDYADFVRQAAIPPKPAEDAGPNMEWVLTGGPGTEKWTKQALSPGQTKTTV